MRTVFYLLGLAFVALGIGLVQGETSSEEVVVPPEGEECNFECEADKADALTDVYQQGKVYTYSFKTVQNISVQTSHEEIKDSQSPVTIEGSFNLVRGSGADSCFRTLWISNCHATFYKLGEETPTRLDLDLSLPVRYVHNHKFNEDLKQRQRAICLPDDQPWKNDIRRSIISHLHTNLAFYKSQTPGQDLPVAGFVSDEIDTNPSGLTLYLKWDHASPSISKARIFGHKHEKLTRAIVDIIKSGEQRQSRVLDLISHNSDIETTPQVIPQSHNTLKEIFWSELVNSHIFAFGFQICKQSFQENILSQVECEEIQATDSGIQLRTSSEAKSILKLESVSTTSEVKIPFDLSTVHTSLHKASIVPEVDLIVQTKDPKILQQFEQIAVGQQLCDSIQNSERTLKYVQRMKKLFPIIPRETLDKTYASVKEMNCGDGLGTKLFLDIVAMSPSEDTVEFMVDAVLKGEVGEETFRTFIRAAASLPTEEKYARSRAVAAMTKLILQKSELHFDIPNKKFVLYVTGFLDKIRVPDTPIVTKLMYTASSYIKALKDFVEKDDIDRGTKLEVLRKINQITDDDEDDNCDEVAHNDFEKLKCLRPCETKDEGYLKRIILGKKYPEDLKVVAYLFMRNCDKYQEKWGRVVEEILEDKDLDIEVKKFILLHIEAVDAPAEEHAALIPLTEEERESSIGKTIYHHSSIRSDYGISNPSGEINYEYNVAMSNPVLPRLVTAAITVNTGGGYRSKFELELLRTRSKETGFTEIFLTLKQDGFTIKTENVIIDQTKLLELLKDLNWKSLTKFFQIINPLNAPILSRIFQNHNKHSIRTFHLDQKIRSIPSLSGLPIILQSQADMTLSFNYTSNLASLKTMGEEWDALFSLEPSVSWKSGESVALGLGHNEVSGYKLGFHVFAQLNFGFYVSKTRDGSLKMKVKFHKENNKNEEDSHAMHYEFEILNLKKIQLLESFTEMETVEDVWARFDPVLEEGDRRDDEYVTETSLSNCSALLSDGSCYQKIKLRGYLDSLPFYTVGKGYCIVPEVNLEIVPVVNLGMFRGVQDGSVTFKLYPSNATRSNSYFGEVSMASNRTTQTRQVAITWESPKRDVAILGSLVMNSTESSVSLCYSINNSEYGLDIYVKKKPFENAHKFKKLVGSSGDNVRRKRGAISEYRETILQNGPLDDQTLEFGIKARTPIPGWEKVTVVDTGIVYVKDGYLYIWAETEGIHRNLNSEIQITSNVEHNAKSSVKVDSGNKEFPGIIIKTTIDAENEYLGHFNLQNTRFEAELDPEDNYRSATTGTLQVHYGREEVQTINGEYTDFHKVYKQKPKASSGDEWLPVDKHSRHVSLKSSQFPMLDLTYKLSGTGNNQGQTIAWCSNMIHNVEKHQLQFKKVAFIPIELRIESYLTDLAQNTGLDRKCNRKHTTSYKFEVKDFLLLSTKLYKDHEALRVQMLEFYGNTGSADLNVHFSHEDDENGQPRMCLQTKLHTETDKTYRMEHNVTRVTDTDLKYKGSFSVTPLGPKLKANGKFEIEAGSCLLVKGFNLTLTEQDWVEPVLVSFNRIHTDDNFDYKFWAEDKHTKYLDTSFSKNSANTKFPVKAKAYVKNYFKSEIQGGPQEIILKTEVNPVNLDINGRILISTAEDDFNFLNVTVGVHSLMSPDVQMYAMFVSDSLVNRIRPTESQRTALSGYFGVTNVEWKSRTNLILQQVPVIDFNTFGQLFPQETPEPVLSIYLTLPGGRKYGLEHKSQFKGLNLEGWKSEGGENSALVGNWWIIEKPDSAPLKFSSVKSITKKYIAQVDDPTSFQSWELVTFSVENNFTHSKFVFPHLDFDINFKAGLQVGNDGKMIGNEPEAESPYKNVRRAYGTALVKLDVSMTCKSDNKVKETKLHSEIRNIVKGETNNSLVYTSSLVSNNCNHELGWSFNTSKEFLHHLPPAPTAGLSDWEIKLSTVDQNGTVFIPRLEMDYYYKGVKDGEETCRLNGQHKFEGIVRSCKNIFGVGNHNIDTYGHNQGDNKYNWEDKLFVKYEDPTARRGAQIYSSKLFMAEIESTPDPKEFHVAFLIVHPAATTNISSNWKSTPTKDNDSYNKTTTVTRGTSIFFETPLEIDMECLSKILAEPHPENGLIWEDISKVVYQLPCNTSGVSNSILRQHKVTQGDLSADVVSYQLKRTNQGKHSIGTGDVLEWESVSVLLKKDDWPKFFHYDFNGHKYNDINIRSRVNSHKVMGSFSATTPSTETPQILQVQYDSEKEEDTIPFNYNELMFRIGKINPSSAKCDKTTWQNLAQNNGPQWTSNTPLSMTVLNDYWNTKMHCGRCRSSPDNTSPTCEDSVGYFIAQSLFANETMDITKKVEDCAPSVISNKWVEAVWTSDKCHAEFQDLDNIKEVKKSKDMSEECTEKLKDVNPCWINPAGQRCDRSFKPKQLKLWHTILSKVQPRAVSISVDIVGSTLFSLGMTP